MSEQDQRITDPEIERKRELMRLDFQQERAMLQLQRERMDLEALDCDPTQAMTPRAALAYARLLVDAAPTSFRGGAKAGAELSEAQREKGAHAIVLALGLGRHLGWPGEVALMHMWVIEGNVTLKPKSARSLLIGKGCRFRDTVEVNEYGVPISHTIRFRRPDWDEDEWESETYTIHDARRARLVDFVLNESGDIVDLRARTSGPNGTPKPWELYPKDMLKWRATGRVVDSYALDLTVGLNVGTEGDDPYSERARSDNQTHEWREQRATQRVASSREVVPPEPPPGAIYDPSEDLALIEEKTGSRDWRPHVGAQVRRRSKVQLAADRVAEWWRENPGEGYVLLSGVLAAAATEEDPVATQPMPPESVLLNPEPGVEHPTADSEPVDAQEWHAEEVSESDAAEMEQRAALWRVVDDIAGGTEHRMQIMHKWILANRRPLETMTAAELEAFIGTLEEPADG